MEVYHISSIPGFRYIMTNYGSLISNQTCLKQCFTVRIFYIVIMMHISQYREKSKISC